MSPLLDPRSQAMYELLGEPGEHSGGIAGGEGMLQRILEQLVRTQQDQQSYEMFSGQPTADAMVQGAQNLAAPQGMPQQGGDEAGFGMPMPGQAIIDTIGGMVGQEGPSMNEMAQQFLQSEQDTEQMLAVQELIHAELQNSPEYMAAPPEQQQTVFDNAVNIAYKNMGLQ